MEILWNGFGVRTSFLNMRQKAQTIKEKIENAQSLKIKIFSRTGDSINKVKR